MTYYLGIDAGGSHCRARLVRSDGVVIGTGRGGTANARIGLDALYDTLRAVCDQAVTQGGLGADEIAMIRAGMGIAGISRPGVRDALDGFAFPFASVAYETDAFIANLGAHGGRDGAILNEGSGAALGLSAMRHALRALDGRTQATPLSRAVTQRFDHDTARAIAWMDQASPKDYGSFAPLVMDHAEADDAIARSIVEDAVQHIEQFIETIFERGAERCALLGGLAPRMQPWLRARTVASLSPAAGDALDGALFLAGYQASKG